MRTHLDTLHACVLPKLESNAFQSAPAGTERSVHEILLKPRGNPPITNELTAHLNRAGITATSEFLPRATCVTRYVVATDVTRRS